MKLKLTIILFFVVLGLYAQKQLQPYTYTISSDEKIQTILIYASAEAVNSIKFTLKNAKNEVLKNDKNEEIIFQVFPFTEVSFRAKLNDAIKDIKNTEGLSIFENEFKKLSYTNQRGEVVKSVRNIYQFFNALVITAFQYDTEPVAGVLKYKDSVTVIKKNIEGLDTDIYFNRQAKLIRRIILDSKGDKKKFGTNISKGKYTKIIDDGFLIFLSENPKTIQNSANTSSNTVQENSYLMKLFEFHQNSKKGNNRNAKSVLKKHIKKQLKAWYNIYELSQFLNEDFVRKYFDNIKLVKSGDNLLKAIEKIDSTKMKIAQNDINFLIASNKDRIAKVPLWNFKISNIEIDFNDGFIEHITVTGKVVIPDIDKIAVVNAIDENSRDHYKKANLGNIITKFYNEPYVKEILKDILGKEFKFENEYPIGFSSKSDFADLADYYLYAFEGHEKVFSLLLTDVINLYVQRHQNDRLNFSPKDQVVRLPLDDEDKNNEIELKKETSSKILNANIFTDFNGLKESEPNGLVQIEVEKQIPLWTRRMELGLARSSNFGFFNYVMLNLTWAKLGEDDRELQLSYAQSFVNNQPQVDKYVTYLDLVRYESTSVGTDLNVVSLGFPLIKTRIELNAGLHYGRINIVDDISTSPNDTTTTRILDKKVNMIRYYPDAIIRFRPDERFGAYLRFRPFKIVVPNNEEFFSVSSEEDFLNSDRNLTKSWLHRYELGAFFTPSVDSDNKFFFRYRYTNDSTWETNGYSEFQVGYLMYLRF